MEQILEEIKQERGESALRDGKQLIGLFADYSKNQLKPQANLLKVFLDCEGNICILDLRNASKQKRQTEYFHLIQRMTNDYGMQESIALETCGAFWRVAIGTTPPALKSAPEPPTSDTKPAVATEQEGHSGMQKKSREQVTSTAASKTAALNTWIQTHIVQHFQKMTLFARVTFLTGVYGVLALCTCIFNGMAEDADTFLIIIACWWYCLMLVSLYHLWKDGFDFRGLLCSMPLLIRTLWTPMVGFFIYFSGPLFFSMVFPGSTLAWKTVPWILDLGGLASWIFSIIWYIQRFRMTRRINLEKQLEKRRKREEKRRRSTGK